MLNSKLYKNAFEENVVAKTIKEDTNSEYLEIDYSI